MSQEFQIGIKTTADLKAAHDVKRSLEEQIKTTKALGQDSSALEARLKRVDAALSSSAANSGRLTEAQKRGADAMGRLSQTGGELRSKLREIAAEVPGLSKLVDLFNLIGAGNIGLAAAGLAAVAGAVKLASSGIAEFAQSEQQVAKLDAALAQAGLLTNQYREDLQQLAGQLQETTGVADDQWIGVLAKLSQFGADSSNIEQYSEAVKNLAGILGGDLNQSATMIARAMQGNFDMFSRFGIVVGETGTQTEKLNRLMLELAQRGGGQLEAQNRTLTGQYGQLKNAVSDFFEAIGNGISSTGRLQTVLGGLTTFFSAWAEILGDTVPQVDGLVNSVNRTVHAFDDAGASSEGFKERLQGIAAEAQSVQKNVSEATSEIRGFQRLEAELDSKEKAFKFAKIDALESAGKLKPSQAIAARAKIEGEFAQRRLERDTKANVDAVKVAEEGLRSAADKEAELKEKLAQVDARIAEQRPIEPRRIDLKNQKMALEETRQESIQKSERVEQLRLQRLPEENVFLNRAKAEADEAANRLKLSERLVSTLENMLPAQEKSLQELHGEQDKLRRELEATSRAYSDLQRQLERQKQFLESENDALRLGDEFERQTRTLKTNQQIRAAEERESSKSQQPNVNRGARPDRNPRARTVGQEAEDGSVINGAAVAEATRQAGNQAQHSIIELGRTTAAALLNLAALIRQQGTEISRLEQRFSDADSRMKNLRLR